MRGLGAMACENTNKVRRYKNIVLDLLVHGWYDAMSSEVTHETMKTDHQPRQNLRERSGLLPHRHAFHTRAVWDAANDSPRYPAFCLGNWQPLLGRNGRNFHRIKQTQDSLLIHLQARNPQVAKTCEARSPACSPFLRQRKEHRATGKCFHVSTLRESWLFPPLLTLQLSLRAFCDCNRKGVLGEQLMAKIILWNCVIISKVNLNCFHICWFLPIWIRWEGTYFL